MWAGEAGCRWLEWIKYAHHHRDTVQTVQQTWVSVQDSQCVNILSSVTHQQPVNTEWHESAKLFNKVFKQGNTATTFPSRMLLSRRIIYRGNCNSLVKVINKVKMLQSRLCSCSSKFQRGKITLQQMVTNGASPTLRSLTGCSQEVQQIISSSNQNQTYIMRKKKLKREVLICTGNTFLQRCNLDAFTFNKKCSF